MSFNGSGLFQINSAGQPVTNGTTIDATVHNALTADIATGLSNVICKDGQSTPTANIPMGNNKITGLAPATNRTDAASLATIQDGTGVYVGTVGGTADVITLTTSPALTAYTAGQTFRFLASGDNTTNVTVNISGLGAKAITKNGAVALVAGDLKSGAMIECTYDGTRFILTSPSLNVPDNLFRVVGSSDGTKKVAFEVDGLTTATTRTVTVPDKSGTMALVGDLLTLGTPQNSTSGTSIDFTSIPSTVKRITICFSDVSTNGGDNVIIQIGDSGGVETSGYSGTSLFAINTNTCTVGQNTSGARILGQQAAALRHGAIVLQLMNSSTNTWAITGQIGFSGHDWHSSLSYTKSLSAPLDRVRVTTDSGVNTFDAGVINILYE